MVKLMTFYYPNSDPTFMHNISSYFLASNYEAARFAEFGLFVSIANPVLSFCKAVILFGDVSNTNRHTILVDVFKVLLFILKESKHRDFVSLRDSCPWLFTGNMTNRDRRYREDEGTELSCIVSEFFQVIFDRFKVDYVITGQLASVVNRLETISQEVSKQYFDARVSNSDDISNVKYLQLFSVNQSTSDLTTRKLSYAAAMESAERNKRLQEVCRLVALWPDVDLLKDILRDNIGQACNQISFDLGRENMASLIGNFERVRDLTEGLHLIHRTRKDFDECYADFKRVFILLAKIFISRKERLGAQTRKLLFKEKLVLANLLISNADYRSKDSDNIIDQIQMKEEHHFNSEEYFKHLGFLKMKCSSSRLTEVNLKSIQTILKTVL